MKYHINETTGRVNICRAKEGNCPLAPAEEHYTSKEAARSGYERTQVALPAPSSKRTSNVDPRTGYLTAEAAAKVKVQGIVCPYCGASMNDPQKLKVLIQPYDEVPCSSCAKPFDLEAANVELKEGDPSYKFYDDDEVRNATWYHATHLENWLGDEKAAFSYFEAHVGTEEAAFDRGISEYAIHGSRSNGFYLYEVKLAEDVTIAKEVVKDENGVVAYDGSDVTRYINKWEDTASISLAVNSQKLVILNKRKVEAKEAHERLTAYNISP